MTKYQLDLDYILALTEGAFAPDDELLVLEVLDSLGYDLVLEEIRYT